MQTVGGPVIFALLGLMLLIAAGAVVALASVLFSRKKK